MHSHTQKLESKLNAILTIVVKGSIPMHAVEGKFILYYVPTFTLFTRLFLAGGRGWLTHSKMLSMAFEKYIIQQVNNSLVRISIINSMSYRTIWD